MSEKRNICKYCGGKLVVEYIGSYGSVYALKGDGTPRKRRIRRTLYEESCDSPMIYCSKCGRTADHESKTE